MTNKFRFLILRFLYYFIQVGSHTTKSEARTWLVSATPPAHPPARPTPNLHLSPPPLAFSVSLALVTPSPPHPGEDTKMGQALGFRFEGSALQRYGLEFRRNSNLEDTDSILNIRILRMFMQYSKGNCTYICFFIHNH